MGSPASNQSGVGWTEQRAAQAIQAVEAPFEPTDGQRCHAGMDGECSWEDCPQRVLYRVFCPLAYRGDDE